MTLFVIIALAVVVLVGALLFYAGRSSQAPPQIMNLGTSFFFWLGMGYLMLLLLVAIAYINLYTPRQPYLIRGMLPIAIPWFGALGAVMISLEGVFLKNDQWDKKYNYWHIGRPLFGAVLGIVSFFLYVVIISASGTQPKFLLPNHSETNAFDFIIFYMVSFLVGYREETFRELIKRVTDLILKPSAVVAASPKADFRENGVPLAVVDFPPRNSGTSDRRTIEVQNTGDVPLIDPVLEVKAADAASAGMFGMENDNVTGHGDLVPGQGKTVDLTFSPTASGKYSGTLTLKARNLAVPQTIRLSGTAN